MTTDALDDKKIDVQTQSVYADRIIGMALGLGVSKLILGNEISHGNYAPTLTLVMPTLSLMDALNGLQKSFDENTESKQKLIEQLDALRERLTQ
ncbi:MAG: hypothetical protein WCK96_09780 [Methylococcales bacterium]